MTREEKLQRLFAAGKHTQLIDYVLINTKLFNILISTYIAGPARDTQRLAPIITALVLKNVELLRPHWGRLLKALHDPRVSTALKRNTIRMFQWVPMPRRYQGEVLDICFGHLQKQSTEIAVKVFSMSVCELLTRGSNDLRRELSIVIEDQLAYAGPAFRSRAKKVLKLLEVRDPLSMSGKPDPGRTPRLHRKPS